MPATTDGGGNQTGAGPRSSTPSSLVKPGVIRWNLLTFGRRLRQGGIPVGSGQVLSLLEAFAAIDPRHQRDAYYAARSTLVTRPEQIPLFDSEFATFWRRLAGVEPPPLEAFQASDAPDVLSLPDVSRKKTEERTGSGEAEVEREVLALSEADDEPANADDLEDMESPPEDVLLFSAREVLRKKDFSQCSAEEIAEARRIIEGMTWKLGTRQIRRRQKAKRGDMIDPRRTMRRSLRHGGVPIDLQYQRRKVRTRPLVLICDISGSMDRYARLLLRFVHALGHGIESTEVFVFGTRLTRITRELRKRDVDQALTDVVNSVDDWSGGTRIGEAIKQFNYKWSRRVVRSGATVVIISDGWDRGTPDFLGREMARLQRSCRRLIWLNPLLGASGYQPLTQGMRAALPYVDEFLPVHNLQSLEALAALLSQVEDQPPVRKTIPPAAA
ncbi:MAG: VWA domain-containing protein [Chloroflexia bacterium]|nr:VWA domain-containing protein [Chloroflexia bacterium]